jgi:uncharacterized protein (TIGR00369 family)
MTNGSGKLAVDFDTLAAMVKDCAFHRWLGVRLKALDADSVEIELPWREEFSSDPEIHYAHGGVLASFIDLAADYAVAARLGRGVPTIDLHVDYHRPAFPGALVALASVVKLGGTVGVAEARVFDAKRALVATGRALFLTRAPDAAKEEAKA